MLEIVLAVPALVQSLPGTAAESDLPSDRCQDRATPYVSLRDDFKARLREERAHFPARRDHSYLSDHRWNRWTSSLVGFGMSTM